MRLVFIDDSQQPKPKRAGLGYLLALGAVIIEDYHVAGFSVDLDQIRATLDIPADEEIKRAPDKASSLRGQWDTLTRVRRAMLEAAQRRGVKTVVVIMDHTARYTDLSQPEAGAEILKRLYERVSMHLADVGDIGVIIADKHGGGTADENKWLADTLALTKDGTEYVTPGRIVLPIVTAHSHHVPHLQLADLVVAATTAAYAGSNPALGLVPLLRPLMHRHRLNDINGAGIVQIPEHPNLYYWVFEEVSYSRPSTNFTLTLPASNLDYYNDAGLSPSVS
jgi:hypothetical protein